MKSTNRTARLNSLFRQDIYEIINSRLKDENVTEMVSVQEVQVTADLKYAKVYISIYSKDEAKKKATFDAIKRRAGFIRHELSGMSDTRTVPELTFILDTSLDYADKIDGILHKIKAEERENSDNSNKNGEGDVE